MAQPCSGSNARILRSRRSNVPCTRSDGLLTHHILGYRGQFYILMAWVGNGIPREPSLPESEFPGIRSDGATEIFKLESFAFHRLRASDLLRGLFPHAD